MTSRNLFKTAVFAALLSVLAQPAMSQGESKNTLPPDYPVYKNTGNREADAASFNQAITDWKNSHKAESAKFSGGATLMEASPIAPGQNSVIEPVAKSGNATINQAEIAKMKTALQKNLSESKGKTIVSQAEWVSLSKEKQAYVMSHPETYYVSKITISKADYDNAIPSKQAHIDSHPELYEISLMQVANTAGAEFNNKGKHVIDGKEYQKMPAEKKQHIQAHPELYKITQ